MLSAGDPEDPIATSGTPFHMCRALAAFGAQLVPLGPVHPMAERWRRARSGARRLLTGAHWPWHHDPALARAYARALAQRLRQRGPFDLVFAPFASTELSALAIDVPVVYASDATIPRLLDYHPGFSGWTPRYARAAQEVERRALQRAELITVPSEWAATSITDDYGLPRTRVAVAPFGPNLEEIPDVAAVRAAKSRRSGRVLFIGTNWRQKGGPIAVRAVEVLRASGLPVTLTVCGSLPDPDDRRDWMEVVPRLDKSNAADRARLVALLLDARVLLVPTRNDCFGIAFVEAAACGTPSIAADTGGVSAAIRAGSSGLLLPYDAQGEEYAERIRPLFVDDDAYGRLSASARTFHEREANWSVWAGRVMAAQSAAGDPSSATARPDTRTD